jgi:light-regulated signal transduction histidine kinase (bacteriophytochrome)
MRDILMMSCPYPTINEQGVLRDGYLVRQPRACHKCDPKGCLTTLGEAQEERVVHLVCPKGFSLVALSWPNARILCNGLIVGPLNIVCPPPIRKAHQRQKVAWEEILSWHNQVLEAMPFINRYCEEKARELIEGLHDVTTAVNLVTRNAEAIIGGLEGDTDEAKIDNAPPALKSLLRSIELLHTRLSMSSIVANPESASFGQKHRVPLYKIFHRMVRLFDELAARRGVSIKMQGSSRLKPKCFDSIETLALVLVDNAVKYSLQRNSVYVVVSDTDRSVKVAVQSYGPVVPKEMQGKIFERRVRTEAAEAFSSKGSGLGLYIARIVAGAHGFSIHYKCFDVSSSKTEGWNEFSFEVPPE